MKAIFTDRDGNTTIKEITPPPKPVMNVAVPESINPAIIGDADSFDLIKPQTFTSTRFDLLGVEDGVAYYVEHDANQAMAQIVTLTTAFKMKHPEIDKEFEAEMAAEMEKSPPLPDHSLQEHLQWIYEKVKVRRDKKEAFTYKTAKLIEPIVQSKFDEVLKMMGISGFAGKIDMPFVTSTQAIPGQYVHQTSVDQDAIFKNIMAPHGLLVPQQKPVKPKIVKPKKPPIVPPPKGRMIAKRKE
jgi:hypothetical protein